MLITDKGINAHNGHTTLSLTFQTESGKEVFVTHSPTGGHFTVIYNPNSRSIGKTYRDAESMIDAYKSIKQELRLAAAELQKMHENTETHETHDITDATEDELDELLGYEPTDGADVVRLDVDYSDRHGSAKYSAILSAFIEAAREAEPGDELVYTDAWEMNSAVVTSDENGHKDGINVYRGLPDPGSRIGWYSFDDMDGWTSFVERFRKGFMRTVLRGKSKYSS